MSRTDTDRREYGGYGLNFYWLLHPRRLIAARRPNMSQKLSIATADTHLYTVDNSGGTPPLLFLNGGSAPYRTGTASSSASGGNTAPSSLTPGRAGSPAPRPTTPCRERSMTLDVSSAQQAWNARF
jgi:hypothetical protein